MHIQHWKTWKCSGIPQRIHVPQFYVIHTIATKHTKKHFHHSHKHHKVFYSELTALFQGCFMKNTRKEVWTLLATRKAV